MNEENKSLQEQIVDLRAENIRQNDLIVKMVTSLVRLSLESTTKLASRVTVLEQVVDKNRKV